VFSQEMISQLTIDKDEGYHAQYTQLPLVEVFGNGDIVKKCHYVSFFQLFALANNTSFSCQSSLRLFVALPRGFAPQLVRFQRIICL